MPRFLTRSSVKKIDRFFFAAPLIQTEMDQIRAERLAKAETSEDPTAKSAIEIISNIPSLAGYDQPELWLKVIENTWEKCKSKDDYIYKTMRMRYVLHKNWTQICFIQCISSNTYFRWRKEFLLFALVEATRLNIGVYKIIDQEQEDMEATNVHA